MAKEKTVVLTLKFTVEISPNGTPEETLREHLADIVTYATNRGLITGDTPAEVVSSHIEITRKGK